MNESIASLHKKILSKELSIASLVASYSDRARTDTHNALREVFTDIDEQVAYAQSLLDEGKAQLLTGIPIVIKDNILYAGHHASASSHMLESYVASYDATAVAALKKAGAIIIGRANMDEFAMGSSTENSAFGVTTNPCDSSKVAGGSSGGSAAAVAANLCVVSLGSDTGGSIRQPAAFCGIVGLLPTYGTVSRHGLMAMGSSLDVIGPMGHTVDDVATVYRTIACSQADSYDATSRSVTQTARPLHKKIAVPKGIFDDGGCDPVVQTQFADLCQKLTAEGFSVEEVALPHFADSLAVYYILMPAEVSSNLARFDGVRYGTRTDNSSVEAMYEHTRGTLFGPEVRRRILLGTYVLSHGYYDAYYNKAVALRAIIKEELETVLTQYDAIMTPTTPSAAFGVGEKINDPVAMYLSDLFTVPANIAQLPALSVPCGVDAAGLPLGIQYIGAAGAEETLFTLGKVIENIR